jgi:hypothetical protein
MARLIYGFPTLLLFGLLAGEAKAVDAIYTYDALGRLSGVVYTCSASASYSYDAAGNRTAYSAASVTGCPPVANSDTLSVAFNTPATIDPRTNDSDPNGFALTITSASTPSHGTAVVNSGTSVTYTPGTGYYGSDSFIYAISNGHGGTASATVSVAVVNSPPTALNDTPATNENTAFTYDPRINDSDPDHDALTITATSTPSHGTVTINGGISLTYTPTTGFSGTDSFTYTISDGHGHTATATETMTVTSVNQPPIANPAAIDIENDEVVGRITPTGSTNPLMVDSDPDGDPLTVQSVTQPTSGAATATYTSNSVIYTYNRAVTELSATDSFTYTISDGHGHTATSTVSVTINVSNSN